MSEQVSAATPVIIVLPAEIDVTNCDEVFAQLAGALEPGGPLVIADMTSTVFCDTSGVRTLLDAHSRAVSENIGFRVAIPPEGSVRRVLELTGIIRILPVFLGLDEATGTCLSRTR
jgi:anti-sigma B factor antagonist